MSDLSVFIVTDPDGNKTEIDNWLSAMDHLRREILRRVPAIRAMDHKTVEAKSRSIFRHIESRWDLHMRFDREDQEFTYRDFRVERVPAKRFFADILLSTQKGTTLAEVIATSEDAARARLLAAVNVIGIDDVREHQPLQSREDRS